MCAHALLCLTLCDLMDWSPLGSSDHGISQARILEGVAISCSKGSFRPLEIKPVFLLCLLHWQADSLSLPHRGRPNNTIIIAFMYNNMSNASSSVWDVISHSLNTFLNEKGVKRFPFCKEEDQSTLRQSCRTVSILPAVQSVCYSPCHFVWYFRFCSVTPVMVALVLLIITLCLFQQVKKFFWAPPSPVT